MAEIGKKFEGGQVVMTAGVNNLIAKNIEFSNQVVGSLRRHFSGTGVTWVTKIKKQTMMLW